MVTYFVPIGHKTIQAQASGNNLMQTLMPVTDRIRPITVDRDFDSIVAK